MKPWACSEGQRRASKWASLAAPAVIASLAVAGCLRAGTTDSETAASVQAASPKLILHMVPEKSELTKPTTLVVSFDLENRGDQSVYVCQWPGIAFGGGWELADGKTKGFGPGYPSTTKLERKYFIELKPGEALLGRGMLEVFPTEAGEIRLWGIFRSGQSGQEYGLTAWKGEVTSEAVTIRVPKEP